MNKWSRTQRTAAVLGLIGGSLGVIVGLIQAIVGADIPNWTGHKADPIALGLLTVLVSSISVLSAMALRGKPALPPPRRLAAALGLLVPGSLCFSTTGVLWYLPGAILLVAGVYAVAGGQAHRTRQVIATTWLPALVSVLGGFEILMAVSAGPWMTMAAGVVGGVALIAAPWAPAVGLRIGLLLLGVVPFAVLTWWSVASPIVAVLALAVGLTTLRRRGSGAAVERTMATPPRNLQGSAR